MTEQTDPVTTEVQAPPGVDAGETVSEPSVPEAGAAGDAPNGPPAGDARSPAKARPAARRSRRGGRGRGGSKAASRPASDRDAEASAEGDESVAAETPPEDTDDNEAGAASSMANGGSNGAPRTATARRRRRRGGRGRGGQGRSSTVTGGEPEEVADPEPRPEVAIVESIDDEDVVEAAEDAAAVATGGGTTARRRRRRGGRGRGRSRSTTAATDAVDTEGGSDAVATGADADAADATVAATPARPARTRSRRGTATSAKAKAGPSTAERPSSDEEKPAAKSRTRRSRTKKADTDADGRETSAVSTAGPTRLRRGRATSAGTRRRREPMPIVPRVTDKLMVITEHGDRDQIAILEERTLVQHYVTRAGAKSMVGNVYLGRVQNVLPGMEAAFVDVGRGRNAVLYAGEVNYSPEDLEGKQPPRIERVLKSGQSVLVQVTKDPIGGKGARLTAKISMPGRYLVLQPNWEITGISKRLEDAERKRLRALLKKIRPEGHGLIVRTAAEEATEEDLRADVDRLLAEWTAIEKKAKKASAPAVLYEEPELTVKVVRDLFTDEEYRELATDSERVYTLVREYLSGVAPDLLPKLRLHTGKLPVFEEFHVVEQIHKGLDRKVWLPSGGYLVIDRTEAMTIIDVNTGKSVGKTNLEETVVNTNIEAAREVARQLRLRDIGGMIIIDFIDMLLEQNKRRVVDTIREEMARDKTRSQVFDISPLGLLEVTRKRVSGGLLESFSETCPTCEGRGVILTYEA
jgi:ribonuclease E